MTHEHHAQLIALRDKCRNGEVPAEVIQHPPGSEWEYVEIALNGTPLETWRRKRGATLGFERESVVA